LTSDSTGPHGEDNTKPTPEPTTSDTAYDYKPCRSSPVVLVARRRAGWGEHGCRRGIPMQYSAARGLCEKRLSSVAEAGPIPGEQDVVGQYGTQATGETPLARKVGQGRTRGAEGLRPRGRPEAADAPRRP